MTCCMKSSGVCFANGSQAESPPGLTWSQDEVKCLIETNFFQNNCPKQIKIQFIRCLASVSKRWTLIALWNSAALKMTKNKSCVGYKEIHNKPVKLFNLKKWLWMRGIPEYKWMHSDQLEDTVFMAFVLLSVCLYTLLCISLPNLCMKRKLNN